MAMPGIFILFLKMIQPRGIIFSLMMTLYRTSDLCRVCKITTRTLDYWVQRGVIDPAGTITTSKRRRTFHLFDFQDIVRAKVVKSLRDSGVSLARIMVAVEALKGRRGKSWQSAWLVTDGRGIYEVTDDPRIVESLTKGEVGQLAFSMVAIAATQEQVRTDLIAKECRPADPKRYDGVLALRNARAAV
jgi:DNA-binding transcriptional MerR regulator